MALLPICPFTVCYSTLSSYDLHAIVFYFSSLVVLSVQMEDYKDALKFLGHLEIAILKRLESLSLAQMTMQCKFFYLLIFYLKLAQKNVYVGVFFFFLSCMLTIEI